MKNIPDGARDGIIREILPGLFRRVAVYIHENTPVRAGIVDYWLEGSNKVVCFESHGKDASQAILFTKLADSYFIADTKRIEALKKIKQLGGKEIAENITLLSSLRLISNGD